MTTGARFLACARNDRAKLRSAILPECRQSAADVGDDRLQLRIGVLPEPDELRVCRGGLLPVAARLAQLTHALVRAREEHRVVGAMPRSGGLHEALVDGERGIGLSRQVVRAGERRERAYLARSLIAQPELGDRVV